MRNVLLLHSAQSPFLDCQGCRFLIKAINSWISPYRVEPIQVGNSVSSQCSHKYYTCSCPLSCSSLLDFPGSCCVGYSLRPPGSPRTCRSGPGRGGDSRNSDRGSGHSLDCSGSGRSHSDRSSRRTSGSPSTWSRHSCSACPDPGTCLLPGSHRLCSCCCCCPDRSRDSPCCCLHGHS